MPEYRKLLPNESKKYRELRLEALKNHPLSFGPMYETEIKKKKLYFESLIEKQEGIENIFGAFDEGKLIGTCFFSQEEYEVRNHWGQLIQVYVANDYRGKNIAYDLMRFVINKVFENPKIKYLTLGVAEGNVPAYNLYKKLGFVEFGLQKDYMRKNGVSVNEIFMRLERG